MSITVRRLGGDNMSISGLVGAVFSSYQSCLRVTRDGSGAYQLVSAMRDPSRLFQTGYCPPGAVWCAQRLPAPFCLPASLGQYSGKLESKLKVISFNLSQILSRFSIKLRSQSPSRSQVASLPSSIGLTPHLPFPTQTKCHVD